jgi:hypothetical protein
MLYFIDRHKFGILAAITVYIAIFMYMQFETFDSTFEIKPFNQTARVETEESVELTPENVEVSDDYASEVLNMVNNVKDNRKTSDENYFENQTPAQAAASIKELEAQMKNEAGGADERKKLAGLIAERKEKERLEAEQRLNDKNTPTKGGDVKAKGETMVSFDLGGRDAFQNNKYYVRNPGYKCDNRSRITVVIDIKVDASGNVVSAVVNSGESSVSSGCEISEALKYAKMSRFEYKSGESASGWIKYIFMPK